MVHLSKENILNLLHKEQLLDEDLQTLLKAREEGKADFVLIDVREPFEYEMAHIVPTDMLLPTSRFQEWFEEIQKLKDKNLIIYCRTGNRSYQVQQILKRYGFKNVGNLAYGIVDYSGRIEQGVFENK